jgi:hypothetical protein
MRIVLALLVITVSLISAPAAQAFDRCDSLFATPDQLKTFLVEEGVQSAPVKYFAKAKSIRIETEGAGRLLPVAKFDSQGNPIIVYPAIFPPVLCRLVLTTYLVNETNSDLLTEPARDAATCITGGRSSETCITDYANDLERRYGATFAKQEEDHKNVAYGIVRNAIGQIAKHEFAHHLLSHRERVSSHEIAQIDAEFEADYYAVLNAAETGEAPSAMYYFFYPLKAMEANAPKMSSLNYESASCRATNISDVTGVFGIAPRVLLDAISGVHFKNNNSPDLIRAIAEQLAKKEAPTPSADTCGRLAPGVLRESQEELKRLTAVVAEYADVLPAPPDSKDDQSGLGLNNPESFTLVARLQRTSEELPYLKGLAVRALSLLIHRVELAGAESNVSPLIDQIIQSSEDKNEFLSGDYGRFLYVKAISILYNNGSGPIATRMSEAEPLFRKSVDFLPSASEAWMNLGFIALVRGDCNGAAEMADKSVRTADQPWRSRAESFRDSMRNLSDSESCAKQAQIFASKVFH